MYWWHSYRTHWTSTLRLVYERLEVLILHCMYYLQINCILHNTLKGLLRAIYTVLHTVLLSAVLTRTNAVKLMRSVAVVQRNIYHHISHFSWQSLYFKKSTDLFWLKLSKFISYKKRSCETCEYQRDRWKHYFLQCWNILVIFSRIGNFHTFKNQEFRLLSVFLYMYLQWTHFKSAVFALLAKQSFMM